MARHREATARASTRAPGDRATVAATVGADVSDEEMESSLRATIEAAQEMGAMDRTSDLAQLLWCIVIEYRDDDPRRITALRVAKRIYLEARAQQVSPS